MIEASLNVACAIVIRQGRVLLQKRRRGAVFVQEFPMGKCDAGESFEQAAIRELSEETSLTATALDTATVLKSPGGTQVGFVLLRIAPDATPKADTIRQQTFEWYAPAEIPLGDFRELDRTYIEQYLPKLIASQATDE